jgi:hypothetical protein
MPGLATRTVTSENLGRNSHITNKAGTGQAHNMQPLHCSTLYYEVMSLVIEKQSGNFF